MFRNSLSVVLGYTSWTIIFLAGGSLVRGLLAGGHSPTGIGADSGALGWVLLISVIASMLSGWLVALVAPAGQPRCGWILAACLLATGIGVQFTAGIQFPVWYNLAFLYLLVPVTMLGVMLGSPNPNRPLNAV